MLCAVDADEGPAAGVVEATAEPRRPVDRRCDHVRVDAARAGHGQAALVVDTSTTRPVSRWRAARAAASRDAVVVDARGVVEPEGAGVLDAPAGSRRTEQRVTRDRVVVDAAGIVHDEGARVGERAVVRDAAGVVHDEGARVADSEGAFRAVVPADVAAVVHHEGARVDDPVTASVGADAAAVVEDEPTCVVYAAAGLESERGDVVARDLAPAPQVEEALVVDATATADPGAVVFTTARLVVAHDDIAERQPALVGDATAIRDAGRPAVLDDEVTDAHLDLRLDGEDPRRLLPIQDRLARPAGLEAPDGDVLVDERAAVADTLDDETGTGLGGIDGLLESRVCATTVRVLHATGCR